MQSVCDLWAESVVERKGKRARKERQRERKGRENRKAERKERRPKGARAPHGRDQAGPTGQGSGWAHTGGVWLSFRLRLWGAEERPWGSVEDAPRGLWHSSRPWHWEEGFAELTALALLGFLRTAFPTPLLTQDPPGLSSWPPAFYLCRILRKLKLFYLLFTWKHFGLCEIYGDHRSR